MAKNPGWRHEPARHALAAKGISSGNRRAHQTSLKQLPRLTRAQRAENAIRDMFLSKQYNGKVSHADIITMLENPRWRSMYGKRELEKAWDVLVEDGYVHKEDDHWFWGIE